MVDTRFGLTEGEYRRLLQPLADYSKRYNCHVTELFASDHLQYFVCFRPDGAGIESPNRFACVYVTIALECAKAMAREKLLTATLIEELDQKLAALGRLV
jgi:hypothetical protein